MRPHSMLARLLRAQPACREQLRSYLALPRISRIDAPRTTDAEAWEAFRRLLENKGKPPSYAEAHMGRCVWCVDASTSESAIVLVNAGMGELSDRAPWGEAVRTTVPPRNRRQAKAFWQTLALAELLAMEPDATADRSHVLRAAVSALVATEQPNFGICHNYAGLIATRGQNWTFGLRHVGTPRAVAEAEPIITYALALRRFTGADDFVRAVLTALTHAPTRYMNSPDVRAAMVAGRKAEAVARILATWKGRTEQRFGQYINAATAALE